MLPAGDGGIDLRKRRKEYISPWGFREF